MKPVLVVEGKVYPVCSMDWFEGKVHCVMINDGYAKKYYYNESFAESYVENPLKINMDECLKWVGQYELLYQDLSKVVESKSQQLDVLAHEIVQGSEPFTPSNKRKEYFDLEREIVVLADVVDMLDGYMQDDVDLSGGEDDASVQRMQPF